MLSLPPILAILLAIAGTPQAEARALIERAIQAQGGKEALSLAGVRLQECKGTWHDRTKSFNFRGEEWSQPPTHAAFRIRLSSGGHELTLMCIVNGAGVQNEIIAVDGDEALRGLLRGPTVDDRDRETLYAYLHQEWVTRLLPLLTDRCCTLAPGGTGTVDGRPIQGVKVALRSRFDDVLLGFDQKSGLLVKVSYWDGFFLREIICRDYRPVDPWKEEEELLRKAGFDVDGPALLDLIRKRTPDAVRLRQVQEQATRLGAASFKEREAAQRALIALGPVARPLLREATTGKDLEAARRAREILKRVPPQKTDALAVTAVRLLTRTRPAAAAAVLLAYLLAVEGETAREVRWALAEISPDRPSDPALLRELDQPGRRLYPRGLKLPRRYTTYVNGRKEAEYEVIRVRFYNRFEDRIFAEP